MYFKDLTEYEYQLPFRMPNVYNVGWIDEGSAYTIGKTSNEFRSKLVDAFVARGVFDAEVNLYRSDPHICHLCSAKGIMLEKDGKRRLLGASEMWLLGGDGIYYASPSLIAHYVLEHDYLPPAEYIQAVLDLDLEQRYCAQDIRYKLLLSRA